MYVRIFLPMSRDVEEFRPKHTRQGLYGVARVVAEKVLFNIY